MDRNVSMAILEQLSSWGVKNIFGLVGDDIFYLMDALARQNNINFYHVKHEESAALMASAQAKLTGEIGVCLADGGPGTVHLLNGLADAYMDNVPVLAITGQVNRRDIGTNAKQYIDQQSLMRPLISYTALLDDPAGTSQVMENAYRPAIVGRSVTHVSVPMDVLSMPCLDKTIPPQPYLHTYATSSQAVITGALEMMQQAQRPVILVGAGGRNAGAIISELSLHWGAAIITTLAGTGVVESTHPMYVGGLGHAGSPASSKILNQSDMCLVIGANWWPQKYVPQNIPLIQIDINPAHIGAAMSVSYGIVGESGTVIKQLLKGLKGNSNPEWRETVSTEIINWLKTVDEEASIGGFPIYPATVIREVQNSIPDDAIICLDTGDNTVWFGRIFRPAHQRVLVSGKWRTMGFGIPAAIAAKINCPDKKVIALVGDGGCTMTMSEFLTAVKYNLPITIVIMNNESLAMEKNKMTAGGLVPEGTSLHNPDFARYAIDCGGLGIKVESPEYLQKAFEEALNSNRPALVDVKTADVPVPGTAMPSLA